MAAKARLAIVGGVAAVVAVLAVYALVAGIQGSTNGISVNEEKRGKGTVETLEFKNPVTIRLIDKDGNVVDEKVVYNYILNGGKNAIYNALANATITAINGIGVVDNANNVEDTAVFTATGGTPTSIDVTDPVIGCTPVVTSAGVTCTVTFGITYTNDTGSPQQIDLASNRKLQMGVVNAGSDSITTAYFEILTGNFDSLDVSPSTTVSQIQITWLVSIP